MAEPTVLQTVGYEEPDVETVEEGVIYALDLWTDGARKLFSESEFLNELDAVFDGADDTLRREVVDATSTAIHAVESFPTRH